MTNPHAGYQWLSLSRLKDLLFGSQPERLIAFMRLLFSGFALFAVYIDPTRPEAYLDEVYDLLSGYVVYSMLMMYISSAWNISSPFQVLIHLMDILALSLAVFLTDGLDSPFFTFYTFTVFTATMRWGWRGAISTAIVLAVLFVGISWNDIEFRFSKDSRNNVLVMRAVYLLVTAAMLGYFGAYMERSRRRLSRLAAWPIEESTTGAPSPAGSLRHASNVLGARFVLVVWGEPATPRKRIAYWSRRATAIWEVEASAPWVDFVSHLGRASFFQVDATGRTAWQHSLDRLVARIDHEGGDQAADAPRSYALAPFQSPRFSGCIVVIDPRYHSEDIVSLAEIVAVRIGADLERDALTREVAEAAMVQERVRLARDMHDSVLQDLTAASLMLKSATAHVGKELNAPLKEIGWLLANQQRRIRTFIEDTNSGASATPQLLSEQLDVLLSTLERQWQCKLIRTIAPPDLRLGGSISSEIFQLICEATANAVRHGKAKRVSLEIAGTDDGLQIRIEDDGTGLPIDAAGSFLKEPLSIRKRVAELNGTLNLGSTTLGTRLSVRIPAQ